MWIPPQIRRHAPVYLYGTQQPVQSSDQTSRKCFRSLKLIPMTIFPSCDATISPPHTVSRHHLHSPEAQEKVLCRECSATRSNDCEIPHQHRVELATLNTRAMSSSISAEGLLSLPEEVLESVILYLKPTDVASVYQVRLTLRELAQANVRPHEFSETSSPHRLLSSTRTCSR